MKRRSFVRHAGLAGATLFGGGALFLALPPPARATLSYSDLPRDVRALYHEDFGAAFPDATLEEIVSELRDLGVRTRRGFDVDRIRGNAAEDPLVEFDDMFWTKSELLLYAAVARLRHAGRPRREFAIRFPNGETGA